MHTLVTQVNSSFLKEKHHCTVILKITDIPRTLISRCCPDQTRSTELQSSRSLSTSVCGWNSFNQDTSAFCLCCQDRNRVSGSRSPELKLYIHEGKAMFPFDVHLKTSSSMLNNGTSPKRDLEFNFRIMLIELRSLWPKSHGDLCRLPHNERMSNANFNITNINPYAVCVQRIGHLE